MSENFRSDKPFPDRHPVTDVELARLDACYSAATSADRMVVWAVLNKYASVCDVLPQARVIQ